MSQTRQAIPLSQVFHQRQKSQIDLKRLLSDFLYQIDISAAYGNEVLASLLDKARKQQATETK